MTGRRRRTVTGSGPDSGNAALELVILAPVIFLLICMVVAAGRVAIAQGSIDAAARDAARQASISRSPDAALAAAKASATATLASEGLDCTPAPVITVDTSQFARPLGQPASVTATVSCTVSLAGLVLPGLPGSIPLHDSFTSPLDPFRGRTP
jgi:Flp pilus assembly protein TadG